MESGIFHAREIDWANPLIERAGVLPVTLVNDSYVRLCFSINNRNNNINTFGGYYQESDGDLLNTAVREYNEEKVDYMPYLDRNDVSNCLVMVNDYSYTIIYVFDGIIGEYENGGNESERRELDSNVNIEILIKMLENSEAVENSGIIWLTPSQLIKLRNGGSREFSFRFGLDIVKNLDSIETFDFEKYIKNMGENNGLIPLKNRRVIKKELNIFRGIEEFELYLRKHARIFQIYLSFDNYDAVFLTEDDSIFIVENEIMRDTIDILTRMAVRKNYHVKIYVSTPNEKKTTGGGREHAYIYDMLDVLRRNRMPKGFVDQFNRRLYKLEREYDANNNTVTLIEEAKLLKNFETFIYMFKKVNPSPEKNYYCPIFYMNDLIDKNYPGSVKEGQLVAEAMNKCGGYREDVLFRLIGHLVNIGFFDVVDDKIAVRY